MNENQKNILLCLIISILALIAGPTAALPEGEPQLAPDFELENIDGELIALHDFKGTVIVLALAFNDQAGRDVEKYREQFLADTAGDVPFLKIVQVNKPGFVSKDFIRAKMKKQLNFSPDASRWTFIDWSGSLSLDEKYGVEDRESPAIYLVGKQGEILTSFQGLCSEANLEKLKHALETTNPETD